jgi:NTP pyrophosphatase (non-canonical NTP hydrolase)
MYQMFEDYEIKVIDWANAKGILGGLDDAEDIYTRVHKQLGKFEEESMEMIEAIDNRDLDKVRDEMGDVIVTLVIQANLWGLSLTECLEEAYNKINVRSGRMIDGVFVKDE